MAAVNEGALEGVTTGVAFVGSGVGAGVGVGTGVGAGAVSGLVATGAWLSTEAEKTAKSMAIERDFNMGLPTTRIKTRRVRPF